MKGTAIAQALAITIASLTVNAAGAQQNKALFPEIVDASHATGKASAFFHSFFTAKSRHDVDATMDHFSRTTLIYIDATLGWPFYTHEALKGVFAQYMPQWPPSGVSYPTRILGDEHSALVAFTDTPELFGGEIRILAAVDIKGGKIVRWVDYWDGRNFGAELAATLRTPADEFPTDFKESSAADNASARMRDVASKLHAALASNDYKSAASLFSTDAVYEDMTLRTQVLGRLAIERYLSRALPSLPAGGGSSLLHVVGGDMGGGYEWQAAPAYRTTVRRGITALALDQDGKISRLTTVWDGAMIPDADIRALMTLSLD
jgi:ketosteroid isomerase-like protein